MQLIVSALLLFLALGTTAARAADDPALDKVLREMDAASARFQSAQANVRKVQFEKVVREETTQSGIVYFQRTKSGTEMAAILGSTYVHFANGKGEIYDAVGKKTTPFGAAQDRARVESFLTLGFGGSGKDLERSWTIKLQGNETIDGTPTVKLDLTPKEASVTNNVSHILIWVDHTRSVSLKQEYFLPEGDTQTSYYTKIEYNKPVETKKYAFPKR